MSKLSTLDAKGNHIKSPIPDGLFDGKSELLSVQLGHNDITAVGPKVFAQQTTNTQLNVNLDANNLDTATENLIRMQLGWRVSF